MAHSVSAIFLDRDGTLNVDHGYVYQIDDFQFIEGTIESCLKLKEMGFALVLVTNQSGIARGTFTEDQFFRLTEWMDWSLADRGVDLDAIYFCPHFPNAAIKEYRQVCDCRKPKPGMFFAAKKQLNIDMAASYMVGDKIEDIQAAINAGVGTKILVRSGKPITAEGEALADVVLDSLAQLPDLIKNSIK